MNTTEILYWEKEVKEMMDHVKKIHEKLSDKKALNNDFAGIKSEGNTKCPNLSLNLEESLAHIEKMKINLELKVAEEKEAKLCRMQWEEESLGILRSLTDDEDSNALRNNSREFMDLLSESEKTYDDKEKSVPKNKYEISDKDKSQSNMKPMKFIERNIQLAQCGKGVLSLTDNEKLRIQNLLVEDEEDDWLNNDSEGPLKHVSNKNSKHFYGFDDDSKFLLKRINEQLEVLPKHIHLETTESCQSSVEEKIEPNKSKGNVNDNNDGIDSNEGKRSKNEAQNLKKIEKLLSDLNSVTNEEISPLTSEEMELLIRQAKQNLQDTVVNGFEEKYEDNGVKELELQEKYKLTSSKDRITDLVLNAKCLMPKFKFRYDDS